MHVYLESFLCPDAFWLYLTIFDCILEQLLLDKVNIRQLLLHTFIRRLAKGFF